VNYTDSSSLGEYLKTDTKDLLKAILLLTAIHLYIGFCVKIGHPVGLGYKVQRFKGF